MRKKCLRLFSLMIVLVLMLAQIPLASAAERTGTVHNPNPVDRLNLRKAPSADAASLGKYYNGVIVEQLDDIKSGWVKVRVGNLEGFMEAKYLEIGADEKYVESAMPTVTIRNTGGTGLYLREKQATSAKAIALYQNGATVSVLGISPTWAHVRTSDGNTGFMLLEHLSPKLLWQYETGGSSGGNGGGWAGPTRIHGVAKWPLVINEYLAAVKNPNAQDRLHLRTAASEAAPSLGKYYNGVLVIINGDITGEWIQVGIGNLTGYMKREYLVISGDAKDYPASAMPILEVANPNMAGNLHLREKQSTSSKSLGTYKNGTSVILMGFTGEWAHVIVDGRMGFMQAKYLK